jgi:hypothetical protein
LHQFVTPQATYGMEIPGEEVWPEDQRDETGAKLAELATQVHQLLGRGWQRGGQPVSEHDVQMAIAQQSPIMKGLDLLDNADWHAWTSGAAALTLLPRATMLAEIWTNNE